MNKEKYESLPADLQKIIDDSMEFGRQDMIQSQEGCRESLHLSTWQASGTEVITLAVDEYEKWNAAVRPVFDAIAADLDSKGFPGTDLVNFALERAEFYMAN